MRLTDLHIISFKRSLTQRERLRYSSRKTERTVENTKWSIPCSCKYPYFKQNDCTLG